MKTIALVLFGVGVLLAVRVMFFGVRRSIDDSHFRTREWPLAVAAVFVSAGALLYMVLWRTGGLRFGSLCVVIAVSALSGVGARWTVRRSADAAAAFPDPDEDPRYRFQGNVARIVSPLGEPGGADGRVAFVIDGRAREVTARWLPGTTVVTGDGQAGEEVVIEHVDGDVAYVEPWTLVESRL
ncbi:MAG TPA: hypothetical protein VF483_12225 [Gemmatimonadaceae bacterium]